MKKIFCMLFISSVSLFGVLPEPYCSINDLPYDTGRKVFVNKKQISDCLNHKKVMVAIEVGSFLGSSTRFIAAHLPPGGKVYAVDTWLGTTGERWMQQDKHKSYFYQLFLSNAKHDGVAEIIVPIRMESGEAAAALSLQADFIYIDANHEEEFVYRDIMLWYPHLAREGIMCGDDWKMEGVKRGVARAAKKMGLRVYSEGNFWKFI